VTVVQVHLAVLHLRKRAELVDEVIQVMGLTLEIPEKRELFLNSVLEFLSAEAEILLPVHIALQHLHITENAGQPIAQFVAGDREELAGPLIPFVQGSKRNECCLLILKYGGRKR